MIDHPGVIVRRLLDETELSVTDAAARLAVSRSQLQRLLGGQSGISAEMALRLAAVFDIDGRALLDRQTDYELDRARRSEQPKLAHVERFAGPLRLRNRSRVIAALRRREAELRELGLSELYLFGSVARDEAGAQSDIDLFFRTAPGRHMGLIELGRLADRLSAELGAEVDLTPVASLKPDVLKRATDDAVRVF